jgi:pimeloyl-ACP methyl ester carboxylesterase
MAAKMRSIMDGICGRARVQPTLKHRGWTAVLVGAGVVGLAAVVNSVLAVRAERREPPRGRFLTIDGVRLHYIEKGEGSVLVLLHGNGVMAGDFVQSGVFDLLSKNHRVIAFDRPGFGFSERPRTHVWTADVQAELLNRALLELKVQRAVIVGHSWGTLVAVAMALRNQANTAGLVLLSGYYFPGFRFDVVLGSSPAVPGWGDVLRYTLSPLVGRIMARLVYRKLFAPSPVPEGFASEFPLELAVRPSQIRASSADTALMIPGAASAADRYAELSVPVALMSGEADEIVDADAQSRRLHAALPQSTLCIVPNVGHMLHHTVPEKVVALIHDLAKATAPHAA